MIQKQPNNNMQTIVASNYCLLRTIHKKGKKKQGQSSTGGSPNAGSGNETTLTLLQSHPLKHKLDHYRKPTMVNLKLSSQIKYFKDMYNWKMEIWSFWLPSKTWPFILGCRLRLFLLLYRGLYSYEDQMMLNEHRIMASLRRAYTLVVVWEAFPYL